VDAEKRGEAAAAAGAPSSRPGQIPPAGKPTVVRPLPTKTLRIGRAEDNDIVVADPAVSRHHAELRNAAGVYHIADLGSNNGTYVNGQRIPAGMWTPIPPGSALRFGPVEFAVRLE